MVKHQMPVDQFAKELVGDILAGKTGHIYKGDRAQIVQVTYANLDFGRNLFSTFLGLQTMYSLMLTNS